MVETIKSTYDFIKGALPVRIGVLANGDAEILCLKNNLSFVDLIKPFSTLTNEAQIQGSGSQIHRIYNLHVHAMDVKNTSDNTTFSMQEGIAAQINDLADKDKAPTVTFSVGDYALNVNRTCPWMEIYRNFVLRSGPTQSHEFLGHLVACMLVVSSSNPDPVKAFSDISQQQNRIQHGDATKSNLKWMTPNTMKYYVLLHDVKEGDIAKAKEAYSSLQSMFGQNFVYLLQINSRESSLNDLDTDIPAPWRQIKNLSKMRPGISQPNPQCNGTDSAAANSAMLGCCLNIEDHSALRNFTHDFILRALLPHLEKTIKNLNDQLSTRKGLHKSLFKATKAIFGSSKSSSPVTTGGYHSDSNELLVRKAADLCFLSQIYDQALHLYHGAKKDFINDQAWLHAAGASEMAAVSNFMMRSSKQSYPIQYMEYAINSYLDTCKRDNLALRCSLIHVECLRQVGMFQEAAYHLVRMTDENDNLRSALLLEQAAYCYLKMHNPQPKKFSFQLVLAGHRFGKCGQKSHAIRCYEMASQIFSDKVWQLVHDHLDYAVGRLYSTTKNYPYAKEFFRKLLVRQSSLPEAQQIFLLREFGNVWHKCIATGNAEKFANLFLPRLVLEDTTVTVQNGLSSSINHAGHVQDVNSDVKMVEDYFLEKNMLTRNSLVGAMANLSKHTSNLNGHKISVGESALIQVTCVNHLGIPIDLFDISLQFDVKEPEDSENSGDKQLYSCIPIDYIYLGANASSVLEFKFEPFATGRFLAKNLRYKLGCQLTGDPSGEDYEQSLYVVDAQPLNIKGKRLNGTREEKFGVFYASDNRLDIQSFVGLPEVEASITDFPTSMVCNEVKGATLMVKNIGNCPISRIEFVVTGSVLITPEDISSESVKSNAIEFYSLLKNELAAGEVGKYSLSLKGPMSPGNYTSNMFLFCKCNGTTSHRSFLLRYQLSCKDGVKIEMEKLNAMLETDCIMSACVESVGHVTEEFSFEKISLSSMHTTVDSIGSADPVTVPVSTKLYKYFKQRHCNENLTLQNSSIQTANVMWNYKLNSDETTSNGQQSISVKDANPDNAGDQNNLESAEALKYLHHTLTWRLATGQVHHHDFDAEPFCVINCELVAVNTSKYQLTVSVAVSKPPVPVTSFSWVGLTKVDRTVEPYSKTTVPLKACFTKPGIYSFGGITVSAIPVGIATQVIPQKPMSNYFVTITDEKPRAE